MYFCFLFFNILPIDPQSRFRSNKLVSNSSLVSHCQFYFHVPRMSGNPKQSQKMPGGNVIQRLSALLYQWWRCLGSLKGFQSRLTLRTNDNVSSGLEFIWISWAKVSYNLVCKTEAYFPTELLSLFPYDCPQTPVPAPPSVLGSSVYQMSLLTTGRVPGRRSTLLQSTQ